MEDTKDVVVGLIETRAMASGHTGEIGMGSRLGDIGFDSLDLVELMLEVEAAYPRIVLKDEDWRLHTTVGEVADLVASRLEAVA